VIPAFLKFFDKNVAEKEKVLYICTVILISIAPPVCGGVDVFNVTFFMPSDQIARLLLVIRFFLTKPLRI
jgi:hypothetical protein